jgi:hypothetical protein
MMSFLDRVNSGDGGRVDLSNVVPLAINEGSRDTARKRVNDIINDNFFCSTHINFLLGRNKGHKCLQGLKTESIKREGSYGSVKVYESFVPIKDRYEYYGIRKDVLTMKVANILNERRDKVERENGGKLPDNEYILYKNSISYLEECVHKAKTPEGGSDYVTFLIEKGPDRTSFDLDTKSIFDVCRELETMINSPSAFRSK